MKKIVWVDDSSVVVRPIKEAIECCDIKICHLRSLNDLVNMLIFESDVYDGIVFDIMMPPADVNSEFDIREDSEYWNGYRFLVNNYNFLNKRFNGKIALCSGHPKEMIESRIDSEIQNYPINIFNTQNGNTLDEIIKWVNNTSHSMLCERCPNLISKYELFWVDDERIPLDIIETIEDNGFYIRVFNSVTHFLHEYKKLIIANEDLNNIIILVDIVFNDDSNVLTGTRDGEQTGISLSRQILKMNSSQKIIGCSNWASEKNSNWFWEYCEGFVSKDKNLSYNIIKRINEIFQQKRLPKTFIVHGWDSMLRDELSDYLTKSLHFPKPIILANTSSVGKTIIEKIEDATIGVDLVFVMCTPDDLVTSDDKIYKQASPNVLIELGYFYGRLGRLSGKVIVIVKGDLNIPSDISGVTYIKIKESISEAKSEIYNELVALRLIERVLA